MSREKPLTPWNRPPRLGAWKVRYFVPGRSAEASIWLVRRRALADVPSATVFVLSVKPTPTGHSVIVRRSRRGGG